MEKSNIPGYKAEIWDIMQQFFSKFNDHQIHCVIRLNSQIDESRLAQSVDLLSDVFPLIRCRFVQGPGKPYWEDEGFSADSMVFLRYTDHPDAEIQKVICSKSDELVDPQFSVYIIRGKGSDTLCAIINHMICDAAGFKEILYLLCSIYSHLKYNPGYCPIVENTPRNVQQVLDEFGWKDKLKILSHRYSLSRHDGNIVFGLEGDNDSPFIVTHTIARERFLAAKSFAKQYGATVNDLILAAYLRALQQVIPGKAAAIQCILDLRKYLPYPNARHFCNLTSNLVCNIGPDVGDEFRDTLLKVKSVMDAEKRQVSCLHMIMLVDAVFRFLPYALCKKVVLKAYRNPPLAMSNIGVLDQNRLAFDHIPVKSAYMTGSVKYKPYFQLAVSTFRDEPTLSVAFHGTQTDQIKIKQFLYKIDRELPCETMITNQPLEHFTGIPGRAFC